MGDKVFCYDSLPARVMPSSVDATAGLLLPLIAAWKGQPPAPHWLAQLHMIGRTFLIVGIANTGKKLTVRNFLGGRWRRRHHAKPDPTTITMSTVAVAGERPYKSERPTLRNYVTQPEPKGL